MLMKRNYLSITVALLCISALFIGCTEPALIRDISSNGSATVSTEENDSSSNSGSASNNAPALTTINDQTVNEGSAITQVDASDTSGGDTDIDGTALSYTCFYDTTVNDSVANSAACTSLSGVSFTEATGVLTWTPNGTQSGSYEFKITGSDGSLEDDEIFSITVSELIADFSTPVFVDNGAANGANYSTAEPAHNIQLTTFNSKLYAIWSEHNGSSIYQIRVAVYNGNDGAPSWSFVDGNGANGINKDPLRHAYTPQLTVFDSKLYATWYEYNATSIYQIRVTVYNGNDGAPSWSFVDGNGANGINKDTSKTASWPQLTVFDSKLYATWYEYNAASIYQIRVAVYNGNDGAPSWSFVDGNGANGINKDTSILADSPQLTDFDSKLYAIWSEKNASATYQIRVAVYNGNDGAPSWSFVDGNGTNGINKDTSKLAQKPQLTIFNSKLYAIWYEFYQIRVVVYNGNDASPSWSFVDGNGATGINKDTSKFAYAPQLTVFNSTLYATWEEQSSVIQTRVAVYNGNDASPSWSFVDGDGVNGINKDTAVRTWNPQLTVFNSKLYSAWDEGTALCQMMIAVGSE